MTAWKVIMAIMELEKNRYIKRNLRSPSTHNGRMFQQLINPYHTNLNKRHEFTGDLRRMATLIRIVTGKNSYIIDTKKGVIKLNSTGVRLVKQFSKAYNKLSIQ